MQEVLSVLILVCDYEGLQHCITKHPPLEVFCYHSYTSAESIYLASVKSLASRSTHASSGSSQASLCTFLIL